MTEKQKAILKGCIWTAIEAFVAVMVATKCTAISQINWDTTSFAMLLAVAVYLAKSLKAGVPVYEGAKEMTDEEALELPNLEYEDDPNYDFLEIDEDVDEGEDDEMEQK